MGIGGYPISSGWNSFVPNFEGVGGDWRGGLAAVGLEAQAGGGVVGEAGLVEADAVEFADYAFPLFPAHPDVIVRVHVSASSAKVTFFQGPVSFQVAVTVVLPDGPSSASKASRR